jgi:hypothetical protein
MNLHHSLNPFFLKESCKYLPKVTIMPRDAEQS